MWSSRESKRKRWTTKRNAYTLDVRFLDFLHESLEFAELVQKRLVRQVLDVLDVVVGFVSAIFLPLWVTRKDTFEDTKTPGKIRRLQRASQHR